MSEQRDLVVRRVVDALEPDQDPAALVRAYFETDRTAVVEAVKETLDATSESPDPERLEGIVDRELISALRLPDPPPGGLLVTLYVRRRIVATAALVSVAAVTALALLLL